MITGLGVDLTSINRINKVYDRFGDRFARRILSASELIELKQKENKPGFLAKRFAVKEAAVKALGTGEREGILLKDFSLDHDHLGKPLLLAAGKAAKLMAEKGVKNQHVSLSDEKDHVVAVVIFEC